MTLHYINLTNGLEFIDDLAPPLRFTRIQSTACEQKRWAQIINDLDNDLLVNLALGNECIIYDCGQKGTPRAIWQGVPWIRYALTRAGLRRECPCLVRGGVNCMAYFNKIYGEVYPQFAPRLKYFGKFLNTDEIRITGKWKNTINDGKYEYYAEIIKQYAGAPNVRVRLRRAGKR